MHWPQCLCQNTGRKSNETMKNNIIAISRPMGIPLIGEGLAIGACAVLSAVCGDGALTGMVLSALLSIVSGTALLFLPKSAVSPGGKKAYAMVVTIWCVLSLYGMMPFVLCGKGISVVDGLFESVSGLTSTGATIFSDVEQLPQSLLLWRSMSEWIGGFGIILLVLAVVPTLGLNKYSLYTAEMSGADNTGKTTASMGAMVRRTLSVYVLFTVLFIIMLRISGMTLWESVNLVFTHISTGGFSIYSDSIARFTPTQQYILAASMFVGGMNFALLFNLITLRWRLIRRKLDQVSFYFFLMLISCAFVVVALNGANGMPIRDAIRCGVVQTVSAMTTTGSVVADTNLWWTPILFLMLMLSTCGGMAGSTTGGLKVMRVVILLRNVRTTLYNRLHPHAVNPVRLNGKPVPNSLITNVMVTFIVFAAVMIVGFVTLLACGVPAVESIGAVFGCCTSYGPGLGFCGGFGSYAAMPAVAKLVCTVMMLLGRLECMTVLVLIVPVFNRQRRV